MLIATRTFAHKNRKVAHNSPIPIVTAVRIFFKRVLQNPYKSIGLTRVTIIKLKLLRSGKQRKLNIKGGQIAYTSNLEMTHALKEIFKDRIYEQSFKNNPYILDCGANIGMSIIYLKMIAPDAHIDAFEPDEINFSLLQKNVEAFGFTNVFIHKAAIWKDDTELDFSSEGSMSSRIGENVSDSKVSRVKAMRLRNYLTREVDFLKMDIEGAEYQVLKDSAELLYFVKNMFIEYHGTFQQNSELSAILEIIRGQGFTYYIKEAAAIYEQPFTKKKPFPGDWDVQLNIFCMRN
jgi:FkbM family methyltransferase